jgi:hypothetical protein
VVFEFADPGEEPFAHWGGSPGGEPARLSLAPGAARGWRAARWSSTRWTPESAAPRRPRWGASCSGWRPAVRSSRSLISRRWCHADRHFKVEKRVDGGRTFAEVRELAADESGSRRSRACSAAPKSPGAPFARLGDARGGARAAVEPAAALARRRAASELAAVVARGAIVAIPDRVELRSRRRSARRGGGGTPRRGGSGREEAAAPVVAGETRTARPVRRGLESAELARFERFWPARLLLLPLTVPLAAALGEPGWLSGCRRTTVCGGVARPRPSAHGDQRQPPGEAPCLDPESVAELLADCEGRGSWTAAACPARAPSTLVALPRPASFACCGQVDSVGEADGGGGGMRRPIVGALARVAGLAGLPCAGCGGAGQD